MNGGRITLICIFLSISSCGWKDKNNQTDTNDRPSSNHQIVYPPNSLEYMGHRITLAENASVQTVINQAEQGDIAAQYDLGSRYMWGDAHSGVQRDFSQAAIWFKKAADQGYSGAQLSIALLYKKGKGVNKSNTKAFHYIKLASDQGDSCGQKDLGEMYSQGLGVARDSQKALELFQMAAVKRNSRGLSRGEESSNHACSEDAAYYAASIQHSRNDNYSPNFGNVYLDNKGHIFKTN